MTKLLDEKREDGVLTGIPEFLALSDMIEDRLLGHSCSIRNSHVCRTAEEELLMSSVEEQDHCPGQ